MGSRCVFFLLTLVILALKSERVIAASSDRQFFKNPSSSFPSVCSPEIQKVLRNLNRDDSSRLARRGHSDWDETDFAEIVGAIAPTLDRTAYYSRFTSLLDGEDFLAVALAAIHKKSKDPQYTWEEILKMSRKIARARSIDLLKDGHLSRVPGTRSKGPSYIVFNMGHHQDPDYIKYSEIKDTQSQGDFQKTESIDFFETLVEYLPDEERRILHLIFIEGWSASEIARALNVKPTRVIYIKDRAIKRLRGRFARLVNA